MTELLGAVAALLLMHIGTLNKRIQRQERNKRLREAYWSSRMLGVDLLAIERRARTKC